jgi:hypothetical protein
MRRLFARLKTVVSLLICFCTRERFFLLPIVIVLLLYGFLLLLTGGLSYVAPFWYAIF